METQTAKDNKQDTYERIVNEEKKMINNSVGRLMI
jgi:hypothetical protein